MHITKRVQKAMKETKRDFDKEPGFAKLSEFYKRMKNAGVAKKQEYSLPQLDTIGRRLNQAIVKKEK